MLNLAQLLTLAVSLLDELDALDPQGREENLQAVADILISLKKPKTPEPQPIYTHAIHTLEAEVKRLRNGRHYQTKEINLVWGYSVAKQFLVMRDELQTRKNNDNETK